MKSPFQRWSSKRRGKEMQRGATPSQRVLKNKEESVLMQLNAIMDSSQQRVGGIPILEQADPSSVGHRQLFVQHHR
jgi:hypothetical protein